MKPYVWAFILSIVIFDPASASAECRDIGVAYLQRPATEIRDMAKHCGDPELADLFYYKRFPDLANRTEFLRSEYDHSGEIVELRLRGFDRIADRLERKRRIVH